MSRKPWTERERQLVADLWDQGVSATIIAAQVERSRNAVLGKIGYMGLFRKPQGPVPSRSRAEKGMPVYPKRRAKRPRDRSNEMRWTPEYEDRLAKLWEKDVPETRIAEEFGCSEGAVRSRASRLGLARQGDSLSTERYVGDDWFRDNDDRFTAAMQRVLAQ